MDQLSLPPSNLEQGDVRLILREIIPGDEAKEFVPYYHFRIVHRDGTDIGHINFRVGATRHVNLFAGHVGFAIDEQHRGHGYALLACRAIAPFVSTFYESVIVTCNPDNVASRRTLEKLGAQFIEELDVAPDDPMYQNGARRKRRYRWAVDSGHASRPQ